MSQEIATASPYLTLPPRTEAEAREIRREMALRNGAAQVVTLITDLFRPGAGIK